MEVYDLTKQSDPEFYTDKLKAYQVTSLPAVIVNGQKISIVEGGLTKEQLLATGVGQSN